ncbi:MAG: Nif3-like dinuclear metal center hexameric protein [Treponema sp.]|jgi:dinuclear metal center YbgI/SA1388 family protein|nr:Nif3-like dinuclear metal center hexameric protein [Treponema sp.]MBQ1662167.1 Nif3-like dinuclear metal center hexameric protein [Treponema sp.]MBQ2081619.1 Nif3-like dinuclear metal center hexameric protein [Treponema sp.]
MNLFELDEYFASFLHPERYRSDPSQNGIQIQNEDPTKPITKIAFATDACEYTARKASENGAQMLFVHHGLFWGHSEPVCGSLYKRISAFIKNDVALYASHIPLDANEEVGNNFGLARRMGLENLRTFGFWKGMSIGVRGELKEALPLHEVALRLFPEGESVKRIYEWGKDEIKSVAIISGGAGDDVAQTFGQGIDAYITGEVQHQDFHTIKELGITVIEGGHYQTETVGVRLVAEKVKKETGIETIFIDFPTGL